MKKDISGVVLKFQEDGKDKSAFFKIYACDGREFEYVLSMHRKGIIIQRGSKEKIIYFEFDDVRWELAKPFLEFYRAGGGKVSDIIHSLYESPSYVPTEFEIDGELISVSPRPLDHLPSGWKVKECTICLVFSEGDLR